MLGKGFTPPEHRLCEALDQGGDRPVASPSKADEWDLVVPDSSDELMADLRRHGVRPGQRLHLSVVPEDTGGARPKRRSLRGLLVGQIPADELLTAEDFEAVHQENVEAANRRYGA